MSLSNRLHLGACCLWLLALAAGIYGPSAAGAEEKRFESIGIGGGGGIFWPARSPHDANLIFCTSDMSGVYRSTDAGKSWTMLPWGQLAQTYACPITFHPTDPAVCYAVPGIGEQRQAVGEQPPDQLGHEEGGVDDQHDAQPPPRAVLAMMEMMAAGVVVMAVHWLAGC